MIIPLVLSIGLRKEIKKIKATPLKDQGWLETFERNRESFSLEGLKYSYWTYPDTKPVGTIWILNRKKAALLLSEGFLKSAEEAQVSLLMSHVNHKNFNQFRYDHQKKTFRMYFTAMKGRSKTYRFWVISFFLYPFECMLGVARI